MGNYLTHTISGTNFVQVKTIEESPIENLKIHFLPKQEGSGTPAVDNVRDITGWTGTNVQLTGKNLINIPDLEDVETKTFDQFNPILINGKPNTAYTFSCKCSTSDTTKNWGIKVDYTDGSYTWGFIHTGATIKDSITINSDGSKTVSSINFTYSSQHVISVEDCQLEIGTTATDYEPYHADTLSLSSLYVRKNLFDPAQYNKTINNIRPYYGHPITLYPGTYTMSCDEECNGLYVNEGSTTLFVVYHKTSLTFTLSAIKNVWFDFYKEGGFAADTTVQLEIGDTTTTHVAYDELSLFPDTIYGGYIDLVTGNIYAEYAEVLNTTWSNTTYATTLTNVERRSFNMAEDNLVLPDTGSTGKYCNIAPWSWDWNADRVHFYTAPNTQTAVVFLPLNTAEDTHIQIVQPYINPVLIGQIASLSFNTNAGVTNILSDVTNTIECTYRFTDYLARRRILTPHIATSTSAAGFETDMRANIKQLKIDFSTQQNGSGDASLSNVRNLTGTNTISLTHTDMASHNNTYNIPIPVLGKNLFDKSTGIQLDTDDIQVACTQGEGVAFHMTAGTTYTISTNSTTTPTSITLYTPYTNTVIDSSSASDHLTYTPVSNTDVALDVYWANGRPADANDLMIEVGSTKSEFWPYFKPGDGYLDLTAGQLVINSVILTYNTANMNNSENYPGWAQSGVAQIIGTNLDKTYWNNYILNIGGTFSVNTKYDDILYIPKSVYGLTQTEWQALAMDIQICVPYTTPQVIQLTPQQIKAFVGENNYTTNLINPTITTKYWTH